MGVRAGVWRLDGITKVELGRTWDARPLPSSGDRVSHALVVTGTYPYERAMADGRRWSGRSATDLAWRWTRAPTPTSAAGWRVSASAGVATEPAGARAYGTAAASWTSVRRAPTSRVAHYRRLYAGVAADAPPERALHLAAESPTATFASHLWRGEGAPLAHADVPYRPLGGAGLRGYDALARTPFVLALNLEEALRVGRFGPAARPLDLDLTLFGDVAGRGVPEDGERTSARLAADAGVGLALRGAFFDRDVRLRLDLPLWVADPELAVGARVGSGTAHRRFRPRLAFSFSDLW